MGWRDVEYEVVPVTDPRLLAVTGALQASHVNGGAILRVFQPTSVVAFDIAARSDLQGVGHWLRCFLEASSVRQAVPELRIPIPLPEVPKHTWYSGFEFEGAVTHTLLRGGAYERPPFGEEAARRMSREFVDAMAGERLQTAVWRIDEPWTDWFYDVAWDATFVVQQLHARRWALLCVTDTD
jgi:hypothetical protein